MGKYSDNQSDIYSIFDSAPWKAENIQTWPAGYKGDTSDQYVSVSIIPSGTGANRSSVSGILIVDIFTPAGFGPTQQNLIADKLDKHLQHKLVKTQSGGTTQFQASTLKPMGVDKVNPSLARVGYEIPFKFFGVIN